MMNEERAQILSMVEDGKISADEAVLLLNALKGAESASEIVGEQEALPADVPLDAVEPLDAVGEASSSANTPLSETELLDEVDEQDVLSTDVLLDRVEPLDEVTVVEEPNTLPADIPAIGKSMWLYLAAAGAVVMAVGVPFVVLGLTDRAAIFWALLCGWGPFFTGLAILTLGAWSRTARWLHLRVSNADGGTRSVAVSLPLPLTLAAWVLRMVRPFVPQLKETGLDETILALGDELGEGGQPIYIDVQDDDGEHVQVYIG